MRFLRKFLLDKVFRRDPASLIDTHPFFLDMDKLISIKIDKIHCPTKSKEKMVKEFLIILFTVYSDKFRVYIKENSVATIPGIRILMHECWKKYREQAITVGVPKIFLEKFDTEYKEIFNDMMYELENICDDHLYDSEYDRFSSILSIMAYCMRNLYVTIKSTIHSLNGELEKQLKGSRFDTL